MKRILILSIAGIMMVGAQAFAACPSGQIEDQTTGHCLKTGSDCDGKCQWFYDLQTHDLKIQPVPGATGDIEIKRTYGGSSWITWGEGGDIRNITIGEGITHIGYTRIFPSSNLGKTASLGCDTCTLKLPSSMKSIGLQSIYGHFGTVEISAEQLAMNGARWGAISCQPDVLILKPGTTLSADFFTEPNSQKHPQNLTVKCKGKFSECEATMKNVKKTIEKDGGTLDLVYYAGLDEDGNWVEYSDDGLAVYTDSTKTKPLGTYDFDGNQTGLYQYDRGGNLIKAVENGVEIYRRRIYTPAEATAAVQDNKNTFKLNYR